eukprot:NODE_354_length_10253_cov_0.271519.p4 type:complete len:226 gc:universal NODE_354_length_10253_cov_0.271519:2186-1509(-)
MTNDPFYEKASLYWSKVECSDNGMLGGLEHVSELDIEDSKAFVSQLQKTTTIGSHICLDCGAGIGRVTKYLLASLFESVDLVESNAKFLSHAKSINLKGLNVGDYYCSSLHIYEFSKEYDCIWIQWVSSQLFNEDYVCFLQRCKSALTENGLIIVKENILTSDKEDDIVMDELDYSFTRTDAGFKKLFTRAGLNVVLEQKQGNWPQQLFPVKSYALRPISDNLDD